MAVRGYVLIETEVGKARAVSSAIGEMSSSHARVVSVDTVTGPFDVIVQLEADDLDAMGEALTETLQNISGVQRTTTCLAVRKA
ncbi:MAG: Lrp/AsnC ligand binding domain-containing protein [Dehalococcoidia bacterium]